MADSPYDDDQRSISEVSGVGSMNISHLSVATTTYAPSYRSVASDEIELTRVNHSRTKSYQPINHVNRWTLSSYKDSTGPLWKRAIDDIKHAPWRWLLRHFVSLVLPVAVIIGLVVLSLIMSLPGYIEDSYFDICKPDGTFEMAFNTYTPWKRDAIFAINMSYGSYSFGLAKFIDVTWDICVGRGGQALLAIFSYRVFTKALSRTMESSSVSHRTFRAVTLQNDTITGVMVLSRDFFKTGGARAKFAMSWTILAGLFILLVPTWLSAMTGYTADISPFVLATNDNLLPAEDFKPAVYTIHDGDRLGEPYTKDYRVAIAWSGYLDTDNSYNCPYAYLTNSSSDDNERYWEILDEKYYPNCTLLWHVSEYTFKYGLLGRNTNETEFIYPNTTANDTYSVTLQPALNISANFAISPYYEDGDNYYADSDSWYSYPYGMSWEDPSNNNNKTFGKSNPLFYHSASSTLYNLTEYNEAGSCQQLGDVRYKWGFSFLLLYAFVVVWLVWTIGMYAFYLDSYLNSRLDIVHRNMGFERAILDLSAEMQQNIDIREAELENNTTLEKAVKDGTLTYAALPLESIGQTRLDQYHKWWREFRFVPWMKEEKWWLGALFVFTVLFVASFVAPVFDRYWSFYFSVFPGFGILQVLLVGKRIRGRWLIFLFWFLAFWGGNIWWIIKWQNYCSWSSCSNSWTRLRATVM